MNPSTLTKKLLPILYRGDDLMGVGKPAGVDVGGKDAKSSPSLGLIELLTELDVIDRQWQPINRLSRYESGIILLGRSTTIVERMRRELKAGRIQQEYLAVVMARMPRPKLILGEGPGVAGKGARAEATRGRRPVRSAGAKYRAGDQRRPGAVPGSLTTVRRVETGKAHSLVRCETTADTTHQLRAQLRGAGLRVLGDTLHDRPRRANRVEMTGFHLARMVLPRAVGSEQATITHTIPARRLQDFLGDFQVFRAVHAALVRRLPLLTATRTNALRLLSGDAENVPGLVADRYGKVVVFQLRDAPPRVAQHVNEIAMWYRDMLGIRVVLATDLSKGSKSQPANAHSTKAQSSKSKAAKTKSSKPKRSKRGAQPDSTWSGDRVVLGRALSDDVDVVEDGLRFLCRPGTRSTGLFLDQRDNRRRIRDMSAGKTVLNLFAYTCGFSVAAGKGDARETVSVDLSARHLEWGSANLALNGLDPDRHELIRADAMAYLKRAARQDRSFDIIVIDAPTFAHGAKRGHSFSFARDLPEIVAAACDVLAADGVLMVSTNHRRVTARELKDLVARGAAPRKLRRVELPRLPIDFAMDRDHAKTVFARVP